MTERNAGINLPENTTDRKEQEKLFNAWENLFVALEELGNIRGKPANSFAPTASIKHSKFDPEFEYNIRINPALLTQEGNVEVVVVDVTYMGEPSQQWVAKANWEQGKPNLVGLDPATLSENGEEFDLEEIAIIAKKTVEKYQHAFLMDREDPASVLSAPEGYSKRIN